MIKRKKKVKVKYIYKKPVNEEEAKEQAQRLDKVFDILFNEVLKNKNKLQ